MIEESKEKQERAPSARPRQCLVCPMIATRGLEPGEPLLWCGDHGPFYDRERAWPEIDGLRAVRAALDCVLCRDGIEHDFNECRSEERAAPAAPSSAADLSARETANKVALLVEDPIKGSAPTLTTRETELLTALRAAERRADIEVQARNDQWDRRKAAESRASTLAVEKEKLARALRAARPMIEYLHRTGATIGGLDDLTPRAVLQLIVAALASGNASASSPTSLSDPSPPVVQENQQGACGAEKEET